MKELKEFVERENKWSAIFKVQPLDLQSAEDRQKIAGKLGSCLSPENLTCDGELTHAQVNAKYRFLTKAAGQLLKLDPTVKIYEFA